MQTRAGSINNKQSRILSLIKVESWSWTRNVSYSNQKCIRDPDELSSSSLEKLFLQNSFAIIFQLMT